LLQFPICGTSRASSSDPDFWVQEYKRFKWKRNRERTGEERRREEKISLDDKGNCDIGYEAFKDGEIHGLVDLPREANIQKVFISR
jgi:hypothetical protein